MCFQVFLFKNNPGGKELKRVIWGCPSVKTPFSCSLSRSTRPLYQHFSVLQDPILTKDYKKFPNNLFKMPKFGKFSASKPKIWPKNLVQEALFGPKISSARIIVIKKLVQQAPKFAFALFKNPHFWPFRLHTPTKIKLKYLPRGRNPLPTMIIQTSSVY